METAREYRARIPVSSIHSADIPIVYASRLWKMLIPGDARHKVIDTPKQPAGGGWKKLPQELVDEILGYLVDDLCALEACSLTSKHLFNATRPLVYQRLLCLDSRLEHPKPKGFLFNRQKREPGAFGRLIDADRQGILRYAQRLTFKLKNGSFNPHFYPRDMQEYLPLLRSITKLHTLTLGSFHLHSFVPVFNEHFGMFTHTLRQLDIRNASGTEEELLYIICQFPLLEDLTIVSPATGIVARPGHPVPTIIQSPPLRGKLILVHVDSRELLDGLAGLTGGLNFHSMVLLGCGGGSRVVSVACRHNLTSISYLWPSGGDYGEPTSSVQVCTVA